MKKDYYEVLGVDKGADEATIKAAYRKLAKKNHPDVNPGDKDAEERFKEINEAYQVLSNPQKRAEYDQYGFDGPQASGFGGGSYGGFMTNWIIGHTDRFCCAATQRSISNWVSFYGTSDIGILFGEYQTDATVFDNPEKMWQQSPLKYAKNFVTPTLIIHSDCDYRCPISEGFQLYTALKERGVDSRMVIFKGENHDLSRTGKPLHRVRRLTEISDWFAKYAK